MPLSMEKRGLLLIDFCKEKYPMYIDMLSVAWIIGGLSTSKEPAKESKAFIPEKNLGVTNIKDIEIALSEKFNLIKGEITKDMRFYSFKNNLFGFDRAIHRQKPVYWGIIK